MSQTEALRTFVSVYRAGSVTEAAARRFISQPAASQHLRALERSIGTSLFVRGRRGVEPTDRGRALYLEIAEPLDRLERTLVGLDAGSVEPASTPLRIGSSAELMTALVLPHLVALGSPVVARFGADSELLEALERGDLDLAVTTTTPSRRSCTATVVGSQRFALIGPAGAVPIDTDSLIDLGEALAGSSWVSYSSDLPTTRRFWRQSLARDFSADLRLVAPDLRVVLAAVEAGIGVSLLPTLVCDPAIQARRVIEVHPVRDIVAPTPVFACVRSRDVDRFELTALIAAMAAASSGTVE